MVYKLGILDQSPIFPGSSAEEALHSTIHLAQRAEAWGYERFWVSEHHQTPELAGSSPEILISYLLAETNIIKVGSGGVMLQHYSPYKVAENFHVLSALSKGRVELGIGKAPGGLSLSTKALRYGGATEEVDFADKLTTLQSLVNDSLSEDHPLYGAEAMPKPVNKVPVFQLGASEGSAKQAAELGMDYVFARFINGNDDVLAEAVKTYKDIHPKGTFIIGLAALAAEDQEEAENIAADYKIYKIIFESGRSISVQSHEQIAELREQTDEPFDVKEQEVEMVAGTPHLIKKELDKFFDQYGIDEFIIHTPVQQKAQRLKSFELIGKLTNNAANEKEEKKV